MRKSVQGGKTMITWLNSLFQNLQVHASVAMHITDAWFQQLLPSTISLEPHYWTTFGQPFIYSARNDYKKQRRKEQPEYVNNTYISGRNQQKKVLRDPPLS